MNERKHEPTSAWQKTSYSNLIRYVPSGAYFARIRVSGKLIRKSLKTCVLSVAKLRLGDLEGQERKRAAASAAVFSGKMTFGDALKEYERSLDADTELKPTSKKYRRETVNSLLKTWSGLKETDVRKITTRSCEDWAADYHSQYSANRFNNTVGTLRQILDVAVKAGAVYANPASGIGKTRVRQKELHLPEPEQFAAFVEKIRTSGSGFSKPCAELVQFLAFGGFRIGEAKFVTWADCDFKSSKIIVRGDPETATKNSERRTVPMIPDMKKLLLAMREDRKTELPNVAVMEVNECQKAMDRAARMVGMSRITHHDLRHLFATRCIESGVDVPTVSRWLGHKDGGALAMRTYGHLRDKHSAEMATRVSFSTEQPANVVPMVKEAGL